MEHDDPTFEEPARRFVRDQESRNLPENTLRVHDQAFRLFRRFAEEQGFAVTAATLTSDLFRRFHGWRKVTPTERARFGGHR